MKKNNFLICLLLVLIFSTITNAQKIQSIDEIKGSIKILEEIINNPDVSDSVKQKYILSLIKQRGQLAAILEQQSEELQTQKKKAENVEEAAKIDEKIIAIGEEVKQLLVNKVTQKESDPVLINRAVSYSPKPLSNSKKDKIAPQSNANVNNPIADTPQDDADENETIEGSFQKHIQLAVKNIKDDKKTDFNPLSFERRDLVLLLPLALAAKKGMRAELTAQAENSRNDKQVGSSSSSSGSTSLVTKGAVPAIFGFAVESGALERSTNGTTVTFRGNPVGIIEAITKQGYIESYQRDSGFDRALRNFSFGLSFDTSRGDSNGNFTGDRQQLSAFSFRYNFVNQRDPRDARFTELWEGLVNKQSVDVVKVLGSLTRKLIIPQRGQEVPAEFKAWLSETEEILKNAKSDDVEKLLMSQLDKLANVSLPPDVTEELNRFNTNFSAYLDERNAILGEIRNGWLVTLEYTNNRPVNSPTFSNFNFIAEKGGKKGAFDLTFNASLSFYNNKPTGMNIKRLRDFNISGQLDVPFGDVTRTGVFWLTFAGKYKRLLEDEPIPNTMDVIKKGDIGLFQAKLVIPIRGTAFKIPLSVSFANRTELIKEREVRGNFGFTFDIDSILAKFNPFTSK